MNRGKAPGGSREELLGSSQEALRNSQHDLRNICERQLTPQEKTYLLHADRGDYVTVKRLIEQFGSKPDVLDINCVDPLNRSALIAAIENENIELIKLLLSSGILVKDALLHAIKEEYVEAVELLLQWEEQNHIPGEPYSWESVEPSAATFTPDITPLILAAHRNHYEILKILLDRGATLPVPHDVKCGCDECVRSSLEDSLRHSQARINAYRALTAPSLIALSSADPLLTAFQLSWELGRLSRMETEFRVEYKALRQQCQEFATALLDHTRTSKELEIMLNYNPWDIDCWEPGERQTLGRLKLAIKYKQKKAAAPVHRENEGRVYPGCFHGSSTGSNFGRTPFVFIIRADNRREDHKERWQGVQSVRCLLRAEKSVPADDMPGHYLTTITYAAGCWYERVSLHVLRSASTTCGDTTDESLQI